MSLLMLLLPSPLWCCFAATPAVSAVGTAAVINAVIATPLSAVKGALHTEQEA
jgi:hypothetical protein